MQVSTRLDGTLVARRQGRWLIPIAFLLLGSCGGIAGVDTFTFECDRASDRCTYSSAGLLNPGVHDGVLSYRAISRVHSARREVSGRPSERLTLVQHTARLTDGSQIALEPRERFVLISDSLPERFAEFRRGSEAHLSVREVHFGSAGVVVIGLLMIGLVLLVLQRSVVVSVDPSARSITLRRRGVIGGFEAFSGAFEDVDAIEVNTTGGYKGVYLAVRDGRRYKIAYGSAGPAERAAGEAIADAVGAPVRTIDDAIVRQHARGVLPFAALGCMLLAFTPLAVPVLWCLVSAVVAP